MKQYTILILFTLIAFQGFSQRYENCPGLEWQACYGGSANDGATTVIPTIDGGYFVAGWAWSDDFDLTDNKGKSDFLLIKITATGNIEWSRSYGGPENDIAWDALQMDDGSFLIAGMAGGSGGDVSTNLGQTDAWLIRVDESGNLLWEKSFGTSRLDAATQILTGTGGNAY